MGSNESAPKPSGSISTGGDNPLMDSMGGGFSGGFSPTPSFTPDASASTPTFSPDFSSMGDVGIGQENNPVDVQAVNGFLNANGIETPMGPDVVDDNAIKVGQSLLGVKPDGNVSKITRGEAQAAIDQGLAKSFTPSPAPAAASTAQPASAKLPTAKPLSTDAGRPQADYFAQAAAIRDQAADKAEKLQQSGGLTQQQTGQRAFQTMKAENDPLAAVPKVSVPKAPNPQKPATDPAQSMVQARREIKAKTSPVPPVRPKPRPKPAIPDNPEPAQPRQVQPKQPETIPALPLPSDEAKWEADKTVEYARRNLKGTGDLAEVTMAPAIDRDGDQGISEVMQTIQAFKDAGMNDRAEQLAKDTYQFITDPEGKARFKTMVNRWYNGEPIHAEPGAAQTPDLNIKEAFGTDTPDQAINAMDIPGIPEGAELSAGTEGGGNETGHHADSFETENRGAVEVNEVTKEVGNMQGALEAIRTSDVPSSAEGWNKLRDAADKAFPDDPAMREQIDFLQELSSTDETFGKIQGISSAKEGFEKISKDFNETLSLPTEERQRRMEANAKYRAEHPRAERMAAARKRGDAVRDFGRSLTDLKSVEDRIGRAEETIRLANETGHFGRKAEAAKSELADLRQQRATLQKDMVGQMVEASRRTGLPYPELDPQERWHAQTASGLPSFEDMAMNTGFAVVGRGMAKAIPGRGADIGKKLFEPVKTLATAESSHADSLGEAFLAAGIDPNDPAAMETLVRDHEDLFAKAMASTMIDTLEQKAGDFIADKGAGYFEEPIRAWVAEAIKRGSSDLSSGRAE